MITLNAYIEELIEMAQTHGHLEILAIDTIPLSNKYQEKKHDKVWSSIDEDMPIRKMRIAINVRLVPPKAPF